MSQSEILRGDEVIFSTFEELLEMEMEHTEWVIDPFLPAGGKMLLYGETGEGKSQLAMSAAFSVVQGSLFLGSYKCKRGPVLYIQADMPLQEWRERILISMKGLTRDREPLHDAFYPAGLNILKEADNVSKSPLAAFIRECGAVLVIVDVLGNTHELDPNKSETVKAVYNAWQAVVGPGAGIMFVHHEKKEQAGFTKPNKWAFSGAHEWLDFSSSSWRIFPKKHNTEIWVENPKAARNAVRMDPMRLVRLENLTLEKAQNESVEDWLQNELRLGRMSKEALAKEATDIDRWWPGKAMTKPTVYRRLEKYQQVRPVSPSETEIC